MEFRHLSEKPITYSGGYYRVHIGDIRVPYGVFDLMGYNKKQKQVLRTEAEHDDFQKRPWWDWGYMVLLPVWNRLLEAVGPKGLPERFDRCIRILLGDFGEYEVYPGQLWGPSESKELINRMLRGVGTDLRLMWQACVRGLRSQSAIPVPVVLSS